MDKEETFDVTIKGIRPLLMHSTAGMLLQKSNKVKSSEYDPEEEAKNGLYLNPDGKICVPGMAILSCLRATGVNLKKGGSGKKTLKDYVFSGLRIEEDLIELPNQKYEIDVRTARVPPRTGSRIMRARAVFNDWMLKFKVTIIDSQTWDGGKVRGLLEEAGKYQGLLDFRPLFGTFEVVSMKNAQGKEVK